MMNTPAMQQIDIPAELEGVQTNEAHEPTGYIEDPEILSIKIRPEIFSTGGVSNEQRYDRRTTARCGYDRCNRTESREQRSTQSIVLIWVAQSSLWRRENL